MISATPLRVALSLLCEVDHQNRLLCAWRSLRCAPTRPPGRDAKLCPPSFWGLSAPWRGKFHRLFFAAGITFDGNRFVRTGVPAPAFSYLRPIGGRNEGVVDLTGVEPVTS